ncbi:hypothetical protein GF312_09245 [Candidatus Poribacteria bacterium]|nr:hypothetical protein [Candidatus Poribacteria bacterium]
MVFGTTAIMCAQSIMLLNTFAVANSANDFAPVEIVIEDSIGVTRQDEIICSGVPFAEGALKPDDTVHVETEDGESLPTQTRILGQWPDSSVKWLLVQFPANCPANKRKSYYLKTGDLILPEKSLVVKEEPDSITIDTGTITATVPKDRLTVLGEVSVINSDGENKVLSTGTPMRFILEDGTVHDSANAKPDMIKIEENGPLRATIRVVGWLEGPEQSRLYKLDTRLRFYAGQSYVKAEYTFICLGQPELHEVKEISLDLSPGVGYSAKFTMPGEEIKTVELDADEKALVSVDTEIVCQSGLEDSLETSYNPLDGWGLLEGNKSSLGVAVRDFWHLCPKSIECSQGNLKLALWSARSGRILRLGRTRAKTHHILYSFGNPGEKTHLNRIRAFQKPLLAITTPEYLCSTDALSTLSPAGAAQTEEYDQKVEKSFDNLYEQRQTLPLENGILHYGDYYHGGYGNKQTRGDLEYDTGHACFLLYARSGDRKYYDFAVACNQHFIDIDVNQETGDQRFHGYRERAETHEEVTTGLEWGHVFTDCPVDAYYFTGDERSLEAVEMIADRTASIADGEGFDKLRNIFAGAERQLGWPLLALCRAYEVTGHQRYLDASRKIVDFIKGYAKDPLAAYREGKWWRSWMMDGCKVFMTGQLHDGLAAYYRITKDEELRKAIVTSLDWVIDNMWNPEVNGFVYEFNAMNRPHRMDNNIGLNMLIVDAYRFGYEMTGDERYLAVATRAFWQRVREMQPVSDGKQFSQDARTSPHTAAYFYRKNITGEKLPAPPQPVLQKAPESIPEPKAELLLQADFEDDLVCKTPHGDVMGQIVGDVEFVEGKEGKAVAVGKGGYVWLPAPADMLRAPGSMEMWVKLHFKKNPTNPGQRAVFHVEGETPLVESLSACTIYYDLRVRMKDHVGHLHGSAEGNIEHWEPEEWHHVLITWDHDRVKLYLDGEEQIREDEGQRYGDRVINLPTGQQTRINLGWRFGNWYCDCDIDSLRIYGKSDR